jgi:hypothetical protein
MFMNSSGHRANIMGRTWDVIGIGAYKGPTGKKMWTGPVRRQVRHDVRGATPNPTPSHDRGDPRDRPHAPAPTPATPDAEARCAPEPRLEPTRPRVATPRSTDDLSIDDEPDRAPANRRSRPPATTGDGVRPSGSRRRSRPRPMACSAPSSAEWRLLPRRLI